MRKVIDDGKESIVVSAVVRFCIDDIIGVIKTAQGEDDPTIVLTKSGAVAVKEDFNTVLARIAQDTKKEK